MRFQSQYGLLLMFFECPPELAVRILLVKIPHILATEHGEMKLVLTWKLDPYWVAFRVLEGAMHTTEEEKYQS